jgi:hypothetical protein
MSSPLLAGNKGMKHAALVTRIIYTYFYYVKEKVSEVLTETSWLKCHKMFLDWQIL